MRQMQSRRACVEVEVEVGVGVGLGVTVGTGAGQHNWGPTRQGRDLLSAQGLPGLTAQ
jgi:hypothetical protein